MTNEQIKTIEVLDKNIRQQIKNINAGDYLLSKVVEDFPFFCFHVYFKKSVLETLILKALENGEIKHEDLSDVINLFSFDKQVKNINNISIEKFKLQKTQFSSKFNMALFKKYTDMLYDVLQKTSYALFIKSMRAASCKASSVEYFIDETGEETEDGIVDSLLADIATLPYEYYWDEIAEKTESGEVFYFPNSIMFREFMVYKKHLAKNHGGYDPHLVEMEDIIKKDNYVNKGNYLEIFNKNMEGSSEIWQYYSSMYEALTYEGFKMDFDIVKTILSKTLSGLLRKNIINLVNEAIFKKATSLSTIAEILSLDKGNFSKYFNILESRWIPVDTLYIVTSFLDIPSDKILGIPPSGN